MQPNPEVTVLRYAGQLPVTLHKCFSPLQLNELLDSLKKSVILSPQGAYMESKEPNPIPVGVLLLPGGEEEILFSGEMLRIPEDILVWSLSFSSELCRPADFAL